MFATIVDRVAEKIRDLSPAGAPRGVLVDGVAALARLRGVLDFTEARFTAAMGALDDHGIGAAAVLRSVTRCSSREADRRARRADALALMPELAAGLAEGAIPSETVDAHVRAAGSVSPEAVDTDKKLLAACGSRPADLSAREIRDWIRRRQRTGDAEQQLHRQRKDRSAMWFSNSDGMLVCNIEFDPVTGAGARTRLNAQTDVLWRSDGGHDGHPDDIRTSAQRRCDAVACLLGVPGPNDSKDIGADTSPGRHGPRDIARRHHLARCAVQWAGTAPLARPGPTTRQFRSAADGHGPGPRMRQLRRPGR